MAEDSIGGRAVEMLPVLSLGDSSITLATPNLSLNLEISTSNEASLASNIIHAVPASVAASSSLSVPGNFVPTSSVQSLGPHAVRISHGASSQQQMTITTTTTADSLLPPQNLHDAELDQIIFQDEKVDTSELYNATVPNSQSAVTRPELQLDQASLQVSQNSADGQGRSRDNENQASANESQSQSQSQSLNFHKEETNVWNSNQTHTDDIKSETENAVLAPRPKRNKRFMDPENTVEEAAKSQTIQTRKKGPRYKTKPLAKMGEAERKELLAAAGFSKYECEQCHKTFLCQSKLDSHKQTHILDNLCDDVKEWSGEGMTTPSTGVSPRPRISPPVCPVCQRQFSSRSALLVHKRSVHGAAKPFLCPTCGRAFSQKPNLARHEKSAHGSERPFACAACPKRFSDKYALRQHESVHESADRFQCDVCGKRFKAAQNLRHHEKLHREDRKHVCGFCGRGFYQASALRRHERTHSGEKPFVCETCQRAFSDHTTYRNHLYTHSARKPYACRVCGKAFIKHVRFKKHEDSHFENGVSNLPALPKADLVLDDTGSPNSCPLASQMLISDPLNSHPSTSHPTHSFLSTSVPLNSQVLISHPPTSHPTTTLSSNSHHPVTSHAPITDPATTHPVPTHPVTSHPPTTHTTHIEWNASKDSFTNGAYIENLYIPASQSQNLPPLLTEHQIIASKDGLFQNVDSYGTVIETQSLFEVCPKEDQTPSEAIAKVVDTPQKFLPSQSHHPTASNTIIYSFCHPSNTLVSNNMPNHIQAHSKIPIEHTLKPSEIIAMSNERIVSVEPLNKSLDNNSIAVSGSEGNVMANGPEASNPKTTENAQVHLQEDTIEDHVETSEFPTSEDLTDGSEMGLLHTCEQCMQVFSGRQELDAHQLTCDSPKSPSVNKCPQCTETFTTSAELATHIIEHKDAESSLHLVEHNEVKNPPKKSEAKFYSCLKCPESFDNRKDQREHAKIHKQGKNNAKESATAGKKFVCGKCGKTFGQRINLTRHVASVHAEANGSAEICGECGKVCYDKYALRQHLVSHRTERAFQCGTCGKCFKGSQHLRHHERQHLPEAPYACRTCGRGFYQASALRRHERTHSGEKPFKCEICGRAFSDATAYKNHGFTHAENKPYSCDLCGKTFIKQYRFRQHMDGTKCPGKNLAGKDSQVTVVTSIASVSNEISGQYNLSAMYQAQSQGQAQQQEIVLPQPVFSVQAQQQFVSPTPQALNQPQQGNVQHQGLGGQQGSIGQQQGVSQGIGGQQGIGQQQSIGGQQGLGGQQQGMITQPTLTTMQGNNLLWQFESVRGDQRIMVQPISESHATVL